MKRRTQSIQHFSRFSRSLPSSPTARSKVIDGSIHIRDVKLAAIRTNSLTCLHVKRRAVHGQAGIE